MSKEIKNVEVIEDAMVEEMKPDPAPKQKFGSKVVGWIKDNGKVVVAGIVGAAITGMFWMHDTMKKSAGEEGYERDLELDPYGGDSDDSDSDPE